MTYLDDIQAQRKQKDDHFKSDQSPLSETQREQFEGFSYFPPDESLRFHVVLNRFDEPETTPLPMNNGTDGPPAQKIGTFTVKIDDQDVTLTALKVGDQYGLHFRDGTNGDETYSAGRFLYLSILDDDTVIADFNMVGNLMCAYSYDWTCPIPLPENVTDVPIRAGEMTPQGNWVHHE